MPGDSLFDPWPLPPYIEPTQIVVCNYDPDPESNAGMPFYVLPHVHLVADSIRMGPVPGSARYRYNFSDLNGSAYPSRLEHVFARRANVYEVVFPDDRIVAFRFTADGGYEILADGFALAAQGDAGDDGEQATFECPARPIREFDTVLEGAIYRHVDKWDDKGDDNANDFQTTLPIRFNPEGRPNCIPNDSYSERGGRQHPVFIDPLVVRSPDIRRHWTVAGAFSYLLLVGNPDQRWTKWPVDLEKIQDFFANLRPTSESGIINPDDESTFTREAILVPDLDVTGLAWADAIQRLIEPHGFTMRWELETDETGGPSTRLAVDRRDATVPVKSLYLQPAEYGATLDLGRTNVGRLTFQDDLTQTVNEVSIRAQPTRREVSVVLAPLFEIAAEDADDANIQKYDRAEGAAFVITGDSRKYREFGADETGDGHWDFDSGSWVTGTDNIPDLAELFRDEDPDPELEGPPEPIRFLRRRRPPVQRELFYEVNGKAVEAELWIARADQYEGPVPGVYDREQDADENTWQKVGNGGWKLADDRLGIIITTPKPRSWSMGRGKDMTGKPYPGGKLNIVKALADPDEGASRRFIFRLTCVIESDACLEAVADRRAVSPLPHAVRRQDDAEDRFRKLVAQKSSHYNTSDSTLAIEDDTDEAKSFAEARRRAAELGKFSVSAVIPYVTSAYTLGDKIDGVRGRDIGFNMLAGQEAGESPVYPTVVERSRTFEPKQSTSLALADIRFEGGTETANFNQEATAAQARKAVGILPVVTAEGGGEEA